MNVILGTSKGKFRVCFMLHKRGGPSKIEKGFDPDQPQMAIDWILKMSRRYGPIDNVLSSSSMDFPKEEGVTDKQVMRFYKVLAGKA